MTLTVELTLEIEQTLEETARERGLSVPEYAVQLLTRAAVEQRRVRQQESFAQVMREAARDPLFMEDIAAATRDFAAADAEALRLGESDTGVAS